MARVRSPRSMVSSSLVTGSIAVHTQCGARDRRVMASASLTSPACTALSSAKSSSSWTCVTCTSCKKYRAKAVAWSATSTNHCSTVFGSTSKTRATARMPVRRDIAQPEPATIATVTIGTEMLGGVDVTAAASRRRNPRGWRRRGLQPGSLDRLLTRSARGLTGETRKGGGRRGACAWWRHGRGWYRSNCGGLRWPHPREHEKHPHQSDQHELVENEVGYHGKVPLHRW